MINNKYLCLIFSLAALPKLAFGIEFCGEVRQGEILIGKAKPQEEVILNGEKILTTADGEFLLSFGRDEINTQQLQVLQNMGGGADYQFAVGKTDWDIQNIKGVPPRKVTPSDSDLEAIQLEGKVVKAALKGVEDKTYWKKGFIMPVEGRISGKFGGQRILNNIPKSPHQGIDIAAKAGTPIKASSDGEVVLAYPDLFYSGNVVVIDHGFGLQTIYAHMQDMKVKRGDMVKQGDIIGTVGQTGRATGPHLHFGASLRNVRVNPQSLLKLSDSDEKCFTL